MKYLALILSSISILMACTSCEQTKNFLDIPIEGDLKGVIIDSLTQTPISGAIVSANFILPNSSMGEDITRTFETTNDGQFLLNDLWDEVLLSVEKPGFEPISFSATITREISERPFNITIIGKPSIYGEFLTKLDLDYSQNDTADIILEVRDLYNSFDGETEAFIFFYEIASDLNVGAIKMNTLFQSQTFTTMSGVLSATLFPEPPPGETIVYSYYYEITDPDGNTIDYGLADDENLARINITR